MKSFAGFLLATWCAATLVHAHDWSAVLEARGTPSCGVKGGGGMCPASKCCSKHGFCGKTAKHCGIGCQEGFGATCWSNVNNTESVKATSEAATTGPSGISTENIGRPKVKGIEYGKNVKTCSRNGVVAVTFDDGPFGNSTARILDLLQEHKVRATFFVTGNNKDKGHIDDEATGHPQMLRRIHSQGHQIAGHTWSHRDLNQATPDELKQEMVFNEMALRNVFGWIPSYMRAPRLRCSRDCLLFMREWGYRVIHASLNPRDWALYNKQDGLAKAKSAIEEGLSAEVQSNSYITVAHDTLGDFAYELAKFTVETAKARGYQLVTVGECLDDPKENWYRPAQAASQEHNSTRA